MTGPQSDDDLVRLELSQILRRRHTDPLTPPMAQENILPCGQLSPPVFERLVLEYVLATENPRTVQIYGKSGHAQYGLDIVGTERVSGDTFVCQCRRLETISPAAVRKAVVDYAGAPRVYGGPAAGKRRFGAKRFLLVTAAHTWDNPAIFDEITKLGEEYADDLIIDVHGAELLSAKLRDSAGIVAGIFGPQWAQALCGREPPQAPRNRATWFGLLEGPISALELEDVDNTITRLAAENPAIAAEMDLQLAGEILQAGYPGHAEAHRHRAVEALWRTGEHQLAFDQHWLLCFDAIDSHERATGYLRELASHTEHLTPAQQARVTVLESAEEWYGGGCQLGETVPALELLAAEADVYAGQLTCMILEQAVIDGLFDDTAGPPIVGDGELPQGLSALRTALVRLAERVLPQTTQPVWRVRLRCAIADAAIEGSTAAHAAGVDTFYDPLTRDAGAGRINPRYGFLAFTRSARAHAVRGHKEQAIGDYRKALSLAMPAGLGGDVRQISHDLYRVGQLGGDLAMYGIAWAAKALPNNHRLIEGGSDARLRVLDWVRASVRAGHHVRPAFTDARRGLWEARISGNINDELWAWDVFADVLHAAKRPAEEVRARVMAGKGEDAANVARDCPDWIDISSLLLHGSPWSVAAAADVIAAQANLIPDDQTGAIVDYLLVLAENAAETLRVGNPPALAAINALRALAHRITGSHLDQIINLLAPSMQTRTPISDEAAEIIGMLYQWNPDQSDRLAELLSEAVAQKYPERAWARIDECRRPGDKLEQLALARAETGDDLAVLLLAGWGIATPLVQRAARRSGARILQRSTGHARTSFTSGWQMSRAATLIAGLAQDSDKEQPLTREWLIVDVPELTDPANEQLLELASSPVSRFVAAVFGKLILFAEDAHDASDQRANALEGLELLLPHVPGSVAMSTIERLIALSDEPRFGPQDDAEVNGLDPLQGFTMDMGGRTLSAQALRAAAHAYEHAVTAEPGLANEELATGMAFRAGVQMRSDDDKACLIAADAMIHLSRFATVDLGMLATHRLARVRAKTIEGWKRSATSWNPLLRHLANDASGSVRRAVAFKLPEIKLRSSDYGLIVHKLQNDQSFAVRHTARRFV